MQGLSYAVDVGMVIDYTGSMAHILELVKENALRFQSDVQENLTSKGKVIDQLRVKVIPFRDLAVDGADAISESPFFLLPQDQDDFARFVHGLTAQGGGDEAESGLEALSLAINSDWFTGGDRRRHIIVVWTDAPAHPLGTHAVPADLADRVPRDFGGLTDLWEGGSQGSLSATSKRLILFAPDGTGWTDIADSWENAIHNPSRAGAGLSEVDYKTILDTIGNSI